MANLNLLEALSSIKKIADVAGDAGGWVRILDFFKRKRETPQPTTSEPAPARKVERVDSLGNRDARLRTLLMSLYGTGEATPTYEERAGFGLVLGFLTPGQREVIKEALGFAGVQEVKMERTWTIPGQNPPNLNQHHRQRPPPQPVPEVIKETSSFTRAEGAWYVHSIGADVEAAGDTQAKKRSRAKKIAELLEATSGLDNLQDATAKAAKTARLQVSRGDTLAHEMQARTKLGFNAKLWAVVWENPKLTALRAEIEAADDSDAVDLHEKYQTLLIRRTKTLVRWELRKRRSSVTTRLITVRGLRIPLPVVKLGKLTPSFKIRLSTVIIVAALIITLAYV